MYTSRIFKKEILEQLKNGFFECMEILFRYKNLGMAQIEMYENMKALHTKFREQDDEESEDAIVDLSDYIWGWCSPSDAIFETYLSDSPDGNLRSIKYPDFEFQLDEYKKSIERASAQIEGITIWDKEFQKILLEKIKDSTYDCREILFKYKNLGMKKEEMYKIVKKIYAEIEGEKDEVILKFMNNVIRWG